MSKKSATRIKVNRDAVLKEGKKPNLRWERFCFLYVCNDELFNNGTRCYAEAYNYNLDTVPKDDAIYEEILGEPGEDGKRTVIENKLVRLSSYDRVIRVCSVESSRLLRKPSIQNRINELRRLLATDEWVDSRLAYLMRQDQNLTVAKGAIDSYNKLKGRITDKTEVIFSGGGKVAKKRHDFIKDLINGGK